MVNAARSCAGGCGEATTVDFISCGGLPRHGAFADDVYVTEGQGTNPSGDSQPLDGRQGEGDLKLGPSLAVSRLPKDRRSTWQMREWASSTRKWETRGEGLSQAVFKCGLTPAVSCAVRSEATEGNQPQGWRQLDQPVRQRREVE
jgi:hypothetical protein